MKNTKPTVSVLMPTYNRCGDIKKSAESVLGQTFQDFELIIIDDGSTDDTVQVIRSINDERIVYLRNQKNLGIQKTLNKGIRMARGKYIARIDDQDEWIDERKLEKQVNFLNTNNDHVLVGTGVVIQDKKGKELFRYLHPVSDAIIRKKILSKNCFTHPSVLFNKEATLSVGGYNEGRSFRHVEDYDLWLKLGLVGKFRNLPNYSVAYVTDAKSISNRNKKEQIRKNIFLIKKYKDKYPGYFKAVLRYYIRLIVYGYLNLKFINRVTAFISCKKYEV